MIDNGLVDWHAAYARLSAYDQLRIRLAVAQLGNPPQPWQSLRYWVALSAPNRDPPIWPADP